MSISWRVGSIEAREGGVDPRAQVGGRKRVRNFERSRLL
jgi:hypothetical protein